MACVASLLVAGCAGTSSTSSDARGGADAAAADAATLADAAPPPPIDAAPPPPIDAAPPPPIDAAAPPPIDAAAPADAATTGAVGALLFSGGNGYVEAPAALAIPSDFTLEAWIYPTLFASDDMQILAKEQSHVGANQFRLAVDPSGRVFFAAATSTGDSSDFWNNDYLLMTPTAVPLNTWTHVAVTRSGAVFTLYVGSATVSITSSAVVTGGAHPLRVAARESAPMATRPDADNFLGAIDDVRVWRVARSAADIAANTSRAIQATDPGYVDLIASWQLDDQTGTTAADQTGAYPATVVVANGSPTWIASTAY